MMNGYLPPTAPARKKLDAIREQLAKIGEELEDLEDAFVPLDEAVSRVLAALDHEVEIAGTLGEFRLAQPSADLRKTSPWVMLRLLMPEAQLREGLTKFFSARGGTGGIASADRPASRQKLIEQRAKRLVDEERETLRLEGLGHVIERNAAEEVSAEMLLKTWDTATG